jgi:hypothetical protein
MKPPTWRLLIVLLGLAACGETSTAVPGVASITLTPANPSTEVGLSVVFEATAYDAVGAVVPDVSFVWASSEPAVATVTSEGVVNALAVGTTAISAASGGASASQPLIVDPSQCAGRVEVSLSPGGHVAYPGDACLLVPSGVGGEVYRVAITRPTLVADPGDVPNVTLSVDPVFNAEQASAVRSALTAERSTDASPTVTQTGEFPLLDGSVFERALEMRDQTRQAHIELRQREAQLGFTVRSLLPDRPATSPDIALADPPSRRDLYLGITCTQTSTNPVHLVAFNDDLVIYQDSVLRENDPIGSTGASMMLDYYSNHVRDMITQYWGEMSDVDGNGRIILTTTNATTGSAAAFSGDLVSSADCASSNEAEIIYFDPEVVSWLDDAEPAYSALGIMAHEAKHVVSIYHSLARGASHSLWVEEGTAEISQVMASRYAWASVGGVPLGEEIDGSEILSGVQAAGNTFTPEMWGIIFEVADAIRSMNSQPNSLITNPDGAVDGYSFYVPSWHFHRFVGDAYGNASTPGADGALFKEMTDSLTGVDVAALTQVTGRTFDQLFEEVVVAMSLDGTIAPTPARSFTTWDMASAMSIFQSPAIFAPPHGYPWPITGTPSSQTPAADFATAVFSCPLRVEGDPDNETYVLPPANARCPIGPAGVRFHDFVSSGAGAGIQLVVDGAEDGQIIVSRIR